ncbi:MAG: hypothetical protein ACI9S8_003074 [Chlamydiales bacterium]|jgi:hypothetical protein
MSISITSVITITCKIIDITIFTELSDIPVIKLFDLILEVFQNLNFWVYNNSISEWCIPFKQSYNLGIKKLGLPHLSRFL